MNTKSKVILGILGAAAAGVVIGMLVAPETGKEARKRLRKTAEDWADSVSHLWSRGKEAAEEAAGDLKDKSRYAKSAAEEKINKVKETMG
ncbi:MAG TPA: YtxH domain-containing protein [Chitinophagaceae bacterium]|nr:YtxH domain-containing protein [Chitinophagaceae bacterium]